jgi:hypothetical protein
MRRHQVAHHHSTMVLSRGRHRSSTQSFEQEAAWNYDDGEPVNREFLAGMESKLQTGAGYIPTIRGRFSPRTVHWSAQIKGRSIRRLTPSPGATCLRSAKERERQRFANPALGLPLPRRQSFRVPSRTSSRAQ